MFNIELKLRPKTKNKTRDYKRGRIRYLVHVY